MFCVTVCLEMQFSDRFSEFPLFRPVFSSFLIHLDHPHLPMRDGTNGT